MKKTRNSKKKYSENEIFAHFVKKKASCLSFAAILKQCFEDYLKKNQCACEISTRVKDDNSLREKIRRKSYSTFNSITDYIGIRIVVDNNNLVSKVSDLIKNQEIYYQNSMLIKFIIDYNNSVNKSSGLDIDKMGYRGIHYVIKFSKTELNKFCQSFDILEGLSIEIQIKTKLEDTWASTTHNVFYKPNMYISNGIKRTYNIVSAMLELADYEFCELEAKMSNLTDWIDNICDMFKNNSNIITQSGIFDTPYNEIDGMSLVYFLKSYFNEMEIFTDNVSIAHTIDLMNRLGINEFKTLLMIIKGIDAIHTVKVYDVFRAYNLKNRTASSIMNNILTVYDIDAFGPIANYRDKRYSKRGGLFIYNDFKVSKAKLRKYKYRQV